MKYPTIIIVAAILIAGSALIAGCTQPQGDTVEELRFGYQPSTHQVAYLTAYEKGWWVSDLALYGVTSVKESEFPTGAPEMQAMLAGQLDVAYVGAAPVISALDNGLDAKIIAAVQTQGSDIVLRPEYNYTGPESLKGLKIMTFPSGTIQDTILRGWFLENGIDPENDLEIIGGTPGDAMASIASGAVDAVFLPHPSPSKIESEGNGRSVVQSGEMMPNHACCVLLVSGDLIRNHPDLVGEILKVHIKATDYNLAHPDEAAQIFADKIQGYDLALVLASFAEWDGSWVADPNLITDSVVDYAELQYDLGYIKKPLAQDDIFDLSFWDALYP